jgi:hypothetical protein
MHPHPKPVFPGVFLYLYLCLLASALATLPCPGAPRDTGSDRFLHVSLETGNPVHVLKAGEENKSGLKVKNTVSGKEGKTKIFVEYHISDSGQNIIKTEKLALDLASQEETFIKFPPPPAFGVYYVDTTIGTPAMDEEPVKKRFSYAYMKPSGPTPGPATGFLFRVCSHPQRHSREHQEREALAAALCGIKIIREDIDWGRIQRTGPETWNFSSFDNVVETFGAYGLEIQAIYSYVPAWAVARDWKPHRPDRQGRGRPDYEHWRRFIRAFADRYKDKLRYVEVWNEPDLTGFANFSAEEYIELLKVAWTETRAANPALKVLTGGFAGMPEALSAHASIKPDVLPKTLRDGKNHYDVIAFHGHGSFANYQRQVESLLALKEKLALPQPWYANETAETSLRIGELAQAIILYKKFLYSWAKGSIGYNWYDLRDDGFSATDVEHHFGLLTRDFYPKAAYPVYNMLGNYYKDGHFVEQPDLGKDLHGYLYKARNGDYLLANWNEAPSGQDRLLMLGGITGAASRVDIFGNEEPLPVINGSLMLEITPRPFTLKISGQTAAPRLIGECLRPRGEFLVNPGAPMVFEYELINPTARTRTFELQFEVPPGLVVRRAERKVAVKPRETAIYKLELQATPAFDAAATGAPLTTKTRFLLDGQWTGEMNTPLKPVITCPATGDFAEEPAFVMETGAQVTTLAPNAPWTSRLFWSGPDDLGARVWLACGRDKLLLKVVVRDDKHYQPHTGADVWKGDNVQIAIRLPRQNAMWEIGLTHRADTTSETWCWFAPRGFDAAAAVAGKILLETTRDETGKNTTYLATIPFDAIGLTEAICQSGFRFNLLVNDNDGEMRESILSIAPGIGASKTAGHFPMISFRE